MSRHLKLSYDPPSDTLYIDWSTPYADQDSSSIQDGVLARVNPKTRSIETLEILNFVARFAADKLLDLPIEGSLKLVG